MKKNEIDFTKLNSSSMHKYCPACDVEKFISEFYTKGPGRYESLCKLCSNRNKSKRYMLSKKRPLSTKNKNWILIPVIQGVISGRSAGEDKN